MLSEHLAALAEDGSLANNSPPRHDLGLGETVPAPRPLPLLHLFTAVVVALAFLPLEFAQRHGEKVDVNEVAGECGGQDLGVDLDGQLKQMALLPGGRAQLNRGWQEGQRAVELAHGRVIRKEAPLLDDVEETTHLGRGDVLGLRWELEARDEEATLSVGGISP
jgi:hypothetical protein